MRGEDVRTDSWRRYCVVVVFLGVALAWRVATRGNGVVHAQATAASGSVVVIPLVVQTGSFATEVVVRNPNASPITLDVTFYEGLNSGTPGPKVCTPLTVAATESKPFFLSTQCSTGAGGHFGMLVLEDAAAQKLNGFFAYSRTQTPGFIGFSVEGFPIGEFSGAPADSLGGRCRFGREGFVLYPGRDAATRIWRIA